MLSLESVTVASSGAAPRLRDLSLEVHPGELLAVLGPNGAGKSTLVGVLAGSLQPDGGCVTLDARPLGDWPVAALARRRAVVAQDNALAFGFRVEEVIAPGRGPHTGCGRAADEAAIEDAMRRVDATALAGRVYTTLSGGERQRVHLARALAQLDGSAAAPVTPVTRRARGTADARYLLLDEPTAALDLAHQHATLQLVVSLAHEQGIGVLAVLHDANLAALYADRVAIVRDGELSHTGTPLQVLTEPVFDAVFGLAVDAVRHPRHDNRPLIVTSRPDRAG